MRNTCNSIKNSLSLFCKLSGQNINLQKSKIILFKNCTPNLAKEVANVFNIKIGNSYGKYLRYPILQNQPTHKDYQFIIDNMQRKLTSWRAKFLNIAGRTTLAISTLNSIPNHAMHYTYLPTKNLKANRPYSMQFYLEQH